MKKVLAFVYDFLKKRIFALRDSVTRFLVEFYLLLILSERPWLIYLFFDEYSLENLYVF
jgi:hypothetical protein